MPPPEQVRRSNSLPGEYEKWMLHEPAGGGQKGFRGAIRDAVRAYAEAVRDGTAAAYKPYRFEPAPSSDPEQGAH